MSAKYAKYDTKLKIVAGIAFIAIAIGLGWLAYNFFSSCKKKHQHQHQHQHSEDTEKSASVANNSDNANDNADSKVHTEIGRANRFIDHDGPVQPTQSIWTDAYTPAPHNSFVYSENCLNTLGARFGVKLSGAIVAIRYYVVGAASGNRVLNIWSSYGTNLFRCFVNMAAERRNAWNTFTLPQPLAIAGAQDYIVSYTEPSNVAFFVGRSADLEANGKASQFTFKGGCYNNGAVGSNGGDFPPSVFPSSVNTDYHYYTDILYRPNTSSRTVTVSEDLHKHAKANPKSFTRKVKSSK